MKVLVLREPSSEKATLGRLYVDEAFECDTLEDPIREVPGRPVSEWKIPKATAIPAGVYSLTLEDSPKFGPDTLTVSGVKGFSYIRVHAGNDADDTEGCLLVGLRHAALPNFVGNSRAALARLREKVVPFLKNGGSVEIEYRNPGAV